MVERMRAKGFLLSMLLMGCGGPPSPPEQPGGTTTRDDPRLFSEGSTGIAVADIPGLGLQKVQYVVKGGIPVHSGDIALSAREIAGLADSRTTSAGRRFEQFKWPNAVVPYEWDASIPVGDTLRTSIGNAMTNWSSQTVITFTPHTAGSGGDYLLYVKDPNLSGGRSEGVGRLGQGAQNIWLQPGAITATAVHEIGHTLGLYHEHQRADRNSFLKVYDGTNGLANTIGICIPGSVGNFTQYSAMPVGPYGNDGVDVQAFDFNSIMIYSTGPSCCDANSPPGQNCCNLPCMTDLNGGFLTQGSTISAGDADGVNRLYLRFGSVETIAAQGTINNATITKWGSTRLDILATRSSDQHLVHSWNDGSGWSALNEDWGGGPSFLRGPDLQAVAWDIGRLDWVAQTSTNNVTHGWYDGQVHWEDLGGGPVFGVTIASQGPNKLDLFAIKQSDRKIYRKTWDNGWTGWSVISNSGEVTGKIDAVSWDAGRLDLVMTTGNPLVVKHMWWTGGASWGIETMNDATGNLSQSPLAAASWGPGRLDIIYNSNSAAKRLSYEGWWGKAMPVLPNVSSIGDAVARHSGNEDLLDYLYYNFASHNFEHAVARR